MRKLKVLASGLIVLFALSACGTQSCADLEKDIERDLKKAGNNPTELEKVRKKYDGKKCKDEDGKEHIVNAS